MSLPFSHPERASVGRYHRVQRMNDPTKTTSVLAKQISLFGLSPHELAAYLESFTLSSYRIKQILHAIYRKRIASVAEITTLPANLRQQLTQSGFTVGLPQIAETFRSTDGTERYLVRCSDSELVETVWMPEGDDGETGDGSEAAVEEASRTWRRATICISSQVGCAVNCQFCLTAKLGVKRHLTAGEIVGQVITVLREQNVSPPQ